MIRHVIETDIANNFKAGLVKVNGESICIGEDSNIFVNQEILENINSNKEELVSINENLSKTKEVIEQNKKDLEENIRAVKQELININEDTINITDDMKQTMTVIISNLNDLERYTGSIEDKIDLVDNTHLLIIGELKERLENIEGITDVEVLAKKIEDIEVNIIALRELAVLLNDKLDLIENDLSILKENFKSTKDFGITGLEENDDTDKIQNMFRSKGNIYFPEGVYNLSKRIDVFGDSTIICHPKAHFIRKHTSSMFTTFATTETLGYDGEKNIKWHGGILQHNGHTGGSNIFSVFHVDNIEFKNVTFLNCVGAHCLDLVGSNDVKVVNCKFLGYVTITTNPSKEAIQIDLASSASYPIFEVGVNSYDGTPTQNVVVEGCLFGASDTHKAHPVAIGQHGQNSIKHRYRNIKIINNIMKGDVEQYYSHAIRPISWENVIIANNIISGYKGCIYADMMENVYNVKGEQVRGADNPPTAKDEDVYFLGCRDMLITQNILAPSPSTNVRPCVWINTSGGIITPSGANSPKHRRISIVNNIMTLSNPSIKQMAVDFDTTEDSFIQGNTIIGSGKSDSVGIGAQDYCSNMTIGKNMYKNINNKYQHYAKSNATNIRKQGETSLWSGKVYKKGTTITLYDKVSNYDSILVKYTYFGTGVKQMDFSTTALQSIRDLNVTDSDTSSTYSVFEIRIKRTGETSLLFEGSKSIPQPYTSGTSVIEVDSEKYYIQEIIGINN